MKKVLIISYSHTGQTETAISSLLRGLQKHVECDVREIQSQEKFGFPWKMRDFFRAFPRCQRGPVPAIRPLEIQWENYDLVICAYQVWFLSPSLPFQGFLQSEIARGLKNKKVITVVTCRNLWQSALARVKKTLQDLGAQHLGQITLCETGPVWASFVTTPRWMLTGKKAAFWFFPEAGLASSDFAGLQSKGEALGKAWAISSGTAWAQNELGANRESVSLELMDKIGQKFFWFWSGLIQRGSKGPGVWQDFLLVLFRANLILLILAVLPLTKIYEISKNVK